MTKEELRVICQEWIGPWQRRLVDAHATPVALVGAGQDHVSGQVAVYTISDMSDLNLAIVLCQAAIQVLERGGK